MNDSSDSPSLSYRDAGVDIDAGNQLVDRLKKVTAATRRPEVMGGIGGFGALVEIPEGYHQPVLVSGTDGVGTKLRLAMMADRHDTIGIDLVAMCANDLIVTGAEPLFFLDYYATGRLSVDIAAAVVARMVVVMILNSGIAWDRPRLCMQPFVGVPPATHREASRDPTLPPYGGRATRGPRGGDAILSRCL